MRFLPIIGLIIVSVSFSHIAVQTDWSGGGGIQGPVSDWEDTFWSSDMNTDYSSGKLQLLLVTTEHTVGSNFNSAISVYAADVDGDGDTDILGAAGNADDISWWENTDGTGMSLTKHIIDNDTTLPASVSATDIDGDGDMDVLGSSTLADGILWWENSDGTGTSWIEHTVDSDFEHVWSVSSEDLDGDGDADVLGANSYTGKISWWENSDGTGTSWIEHAVNGNICEARYVYAKDLDGDGDADILVGTYEEGIVWWENTNSTGTLWTKHIVDGELEGSVSIYSADIDGDGDLDVLGAVIQTDDITWWENTDGSGTSWTEHAVDDYFSGATSVYAIDVDVDGDLDVLGAAWFADDIIWWENTDGSGISWTEHTVDGDFDGACSVYAADINGDGSADIMGAAFEADEIAWWDVMSFPPAGSLESSIFDAGLLDTWQFFSSSEEEPAGTSVGFQFRSSKDSSNMGEWSDTSFTVSTNLSGILTDSTNFVQYRAILQTADPSSTPVLNNVTIFYTTYVSIDEANHDEILNWNISLSENPSFGAIAIQLSVPQSEVVDLLLYDATGRLVTQYSQDLPIGEHTISFNNLSVGVYFCSVHAETFNATERIIVLE